MLPPCDRLSYAHKPRYDHEAGICNDGREGIVIHQCNGNALHHNIELIVNTDIGRVVKGLADPRYNNPGKRLLRSRIDLHQDSCILFSPDNVGGLQVCCWYDENSEQ